MRRDRLYIGIAVALVLASGIWFALSFERVNEREYVGLQGEARRNPYLAAGRMLERMGVRVVFERERIEPARLPQHAVLLLPRERFALGGEGLQALLRWVENGGHLIVEAEPPKNPDPLLALLRVERVAARGGYERPNEPVLLPGGERALKVRFADRPRLEPRDKLFNFYWFGLFVQQPRGQGLVTVVNDFSFLRYKELAANDHAEFVWQLAQQTPDAREAVIVSRPQAPSLWQWLLDNALAVLASGALLLALCLWRIVPRFGPLAPDPPPARKRLLDHLRASGRFHWASGCGARLLASARDACLRNLAHAHPALVALPPAERARQLAGLTGLRAHAIERAFAPEAHAAHEFTEAVRTLQQLQEKLVRSW